jgi:hypothetical protein
VGSAIDSSQGNVREREDEILSDLDSYSLSNVSTLPKCTVVFEVVDYEATGIHEGRSPVTAKVVLRPADYVQLLNHDSVHILLECERSLSPDTQSMSLYLGHSASLYALMDLRAKSDHDLNPLFLRITRVIRVLPRDVAFSPITNEGLPTEILQQIFQEVSQASYSGWRRDLVSCALVCRKWSCSLDLLFWDFHIPRKASYTHTYPPNIHALSEALTEQPTLGLSIEDLSTLYLRGPWQARWYNHDPASVTAFTSDVITVIRTARGIQSLELEYLDSDQTEALASALYDLRGLRTFTTGQRSPLLPSHDGAISIVQLAYCLASWPSLKSLIMYGAQSSTMTEPTTALRLPVCALTELTMERVFVTDTELMYLMSTSLRTLECVSLGEISGITNVGLRNFLDAISQNVSCLTIRHTGVPLGAGGQEERALDVTIGKMHRLGKLNVEGNVASELMLQRRAQMFTASRANGDLTPESALPVIQLDFGKSDGLPLSIADVDWPGWNILEPYIGVRCVKAIRMYSQGEWEERSRRPVGYLRTILDHATSGDSVQQHQS